MGKKIGRTEFQLLAGRPLMSKRNWRDGTRYAPCCVKKPKASFADVAKIKYELMEESSVKRRTGNSITLEGLKEKKLRSKLDSHSKKREPT